MTEDIVLNIRAEIDPVSQNIKGLLEAANPDQEATKQALESIKAEYESLQKELQSDTSGIFSNIPKEMDETLSRTISRIRFYFPTQKEANTLSSSFSSTASPVISARANWAFCKFHSSRRQSATKTNCNPPEKVL